jgi:hypothetical protein
MNRLQGEELRKYNGATHTIKFEKQKRSAVSSSMLCPQIKHKSEIQMQRTACRLETKLYQSHADPKIQLKIQPAAREGIVCCPAWGWGDGGIC